MFICSINYNYFSVKISLYSLRIIRYSYVSNTSSAQNIHYGWARAGESGGAERCRRLTASVPAVRLQNTSAENAKNIVIKQGMMILYVAIQV